MTTKPTSSSVLRAAGGTVLVVTLLLTGLVTAAYGGKKKDATPAPAAPQVDTSRLVWPAPPAITRIRWLNSVQGEQDVDNAPVKKRKTSWMDKMAGVSLPQERGKPRLVKPYGVDSDSKGIVYVADTGNGFVFAFDLEKKKVSYRGVGALQTPSGLVVDDVDRLFVADSGQRAVFVFRPDGGIEGMFGQDRLARPVGLAVDNENRFLYVVDTAANRVVVFDADDYRFLRYVSKTGDLIDGGMSAPTNAAVDSECNLYVTDTFNSRVLVFDADGVFLSSFGKPGSTPGTFMRPKGIAVDQDNHIYVADAEFNNVQIFDQDGHVLLFFGQRGETAGAFTLPTGIAVDKQSRVLVTEQWLGRLQLFRYVPDKDAETEYQKAVKAQVDAEKAAPRADAKDQAAGKQ